MESKKVKALLTAAQTGSLTAAAAELGYTQAGLTQMMNSLESELGVHLLMRGKSGVKLSPAGQDLVEPMRAFVDAAETLERAAALLRDEGVGALRIGAYASITRLWLPAILSDFRREFPEADISYSVGSIEQMYNAVKSGELDCAFVSCHPTLMKGLNWFELHVDELLAVLPPDYPLAGETFSIACFNDAEFLMPALGSDMEINPLFAAAPERVTPRTRYTNLDDAAVVAMVEHGLGLTILSRLILQGLNAEVKAVPLEPRGFRTLGMIVSAKRQGEHVLRSFVRSTRATIEAMYAAESAE